MEPPRVIKWMVGIIGGLFVGLLTMLIVGVLLYRLVTPYWPLGPLAATVLAPTVGIVAGVMSCRASLRRNVRSFRLSEGDAYPPGHCQTCGYNLTGNVSGVCSECGTPI